MKDLDIILDTYMGTGLGDPSKIAWKGRAKREILDLLKEAFEAGRKEETIETGIVTFDEYTYRTFADYLKTKL